MNDKTLLIKVITLLYRQSQIEGVKERSCDLARKVLGHVKLPEQALTLDPETKTIEGLKNLTQTMVDDPIDHEYEATEILQRIRMISEDDQIYDAVKEGISHDLTQSATKRLCVNTVRAIEKYFRETEAKDILKKATSKLMYQREQIPDIQRWIGELCATLEPYQQDSVEKDPAIVSCVDFNEPESLEQVFVDIKKDVDNTSVLKTGWQGLNRMIRGGFRRGEAVVVGALQHNFKTGFMLSVFRHLCRYNKPVMIDPTKKPLMLFISFENEMGTNWHLIYKSLKENELGIELTDEDIRNTPEKEIADYVIAKMREESNYNVIMLRVNPSSWSYLDVCNKVLQYEADGYEIHALFIDYLALLPTTGCRQGSTGDDIRDLFRRMRNFCSARKILLLTPHQLSSEAKKLIRDGHQDFVKIIANKGYYDGCTRLDQEVDLEIYIHIEEVQRKKYLTFQRGKHRTVVGQTDPDYMYFVLPFAHVGAIRDDINGPDTTRKRPGGGPVGSGEETPFWETEGQFLP